MSRYTTWYLGLHKFEELEKAGLQVPAPVLNHWPFVCPELDAGQANAASRTGSTLKPAFSHADDSLAS